MVFPHSHKLQHSRDATGELIGVTCTVFLRSTYNNNINSSDTHLMASLPGQYWLASTRKVNINEARDAVASTGPYANHLHLTPTGEQTD